MLDNDTSAHTDVVVKAMSRVARSVGNGAATDQALHALTHGALQAIPGADFVSITMAYADGRVSTLAPTHEIARRADQVQYEFGEGPCLAAVEVEETVRSEDMATEQRWPRYAPRVAAMGIGSQMAVEIFRAGSTCAALNLYSTTKGAFDESQHIVELFASQAGIAMNFVRATQTFQEALASRKVIGQAIGIVMERYRLDEDRAFGFLVRTSQDGNLKLRSVAAKIVELANRAAPEPGKRA